MAKLSVENLHPHDKNDIEFYGDCANEPGWHHKNKGKDYDCTWVAEHAPRCDVWFVKGETSEPKKKAKDVCKLACNICSVPEPTSEYESEPESEPEPGTVWFPEDLFSRPIDEWNTEWIIIVVVVIIIGIGVSYLMQPPPQMLAPPLPPQPSGAMPSG